MKAPKSSFTKRRLKLNSVRPDALIAPGSRRLCPVSIATRNGPAGHDFAKARGGIKTDNIRAVAQAGADSFVSGSGIFGAADYAGTITDPEDNKEYTGSAKVSAKSMKLKGCALKIFCQTQTWKKL